MTDAPPPPAPQPYGAPPQPQPYGSPGYAQQYGPRTNPLAIVSLVCSLAGLIVAFLAPLAGIITGHIALSQIKRTGEGGRGMALAGVIVGYVLLALSIVFIVAYIAFIAWAVSSGYDGYDTVY